MSGCAAASSDGHTAGGGGGGAPLACTVSLSGGTTFFNVAGSSGDLFNEFGAIIGQSATGGTAPYSGVLSIQGDPSGKCSLASPSAGINTIGWNGFALNEVEICYVQYSVTDSAGAHATARYPISTGQTIAIQRTS